MHVAAAGLARNLPAAPPCSCYAQEELAQRAQRFGSNSVRRPRETTFLQLVQEALQASAGRSTESVWLRSDKKKMHV